MFGMSNFGISNFGMPKSGRINEEAAGFVVVALVAAVLVSVMTFNPLEGGFWWDFLTPPSTSDVGKEMFQLAGRRNTAGSLGMQDGQQQHPNKHNDCDCQRKKHRSHHVIRKDIDGHGLS